MFLIDKNFHPSVETKPDPRSIEGLIAWLETMPADGEYNPMDSDDCIYCRYGESSGLGSWSDVHRAVRGYYGERGPWMAGCFGGQLEWEAPHTFGAALDRARAYQAKMRT